jgi:1-hydroxycarotenoid 3,4-desaturase
MRVRRVAVIGAGIGGLVAAIRLAAKGLEVVVIERCLGPGGKMRELAIGGARLDAGPTVLTMRAVFEDIFTSVGATFSDLVRVRRAEILARHAWSKNERLDLHANVDRSVDAIAAFAGANEAREYRRFTDQARDVYQVLEQPFIGSPNAGLVSLVSSAGWSGLGALRNIKPFVTLWRELQHRFRDPRLRQLFGRYATYCGSSPFLAPATLMLIAHVEQKGVWLVEGGMYRIVQALVDIGARHGTTFRYNAQAVEIIVEHGRAAGVLLASGERIAADAVVSNADAAALAEGRFGTAAAHAASGSARSQRSLSAVVWTMVAQTSGWPLLRHNVFFSDDYAAEFDDILRRKRLPRTPTVYVCAQDRNDLEDTQHRGAERLLCLVNAPPTGDSHCFDSAEIAKCEEQSFRLLNRCGINVQWRPEDAAVTTPADFNRLFPGTGGALYGAASHGWRASFRRPRARSRIPGLYLAGGSIHPGPGVPMAALSGCFAANALLEDFVSIVPYPPVATHGGMSMH